MKKQIFTPFRTSTRDRKGGALISMVAVMVILGVLGVSIISLTNTTEHSHLSANAGNRAYYLAESGLRYAQQIHCDLYAIDGEGWLHGRQRNLTLLGGESVNVIRIANSFWSIFPCLKALLRRVV